MLNETKYNFYSVAHGGEFPSEKYASEKTGKTINQVYFGSGIVLSNNLI